MTYRVTPVHLMAVIHEELARDVDEAAASGEPQIPVRIISLLARARKRAIEEAKAEAMQ